MLVFKVDVEAAEDGFTVTCPDVPALHQRIGSLWEACGVRPVLAELNNVPNDLVWLQIRARAGAVTVVSDVHPLHWVAFHSVARPAHPSFDRGSIVFDHALTALRHEAAHAERECRGHARVKVIVSFLDGTKVQVPRTGGYPLADVIDGTRATGDFSGWLRARLTGQVSLVSDWHAPVIGLQVGVFAPEAAGARRYR
ncbi:hypothetical protein MN0502_32180 [Arthrobacter sp. MN05-02]|nr:hypothetical protein MN0502_32180 [Arthrobacter sp. MN05-02]